MVCFCRLWLSKFIELYIRSFRTNTLSAQLHPESDVQDLELARDDVLVVQTGDDSKVVLKFAQELFSLFVLAIATNVHQVLGRTTFDGRKRDMSREMSRPTRSWENSVFSEIANEVVSGGLAHDITEAYSLIIPAFSRCGNLPEETGFDDLPTPTTDE